MNFEQFNRFCTSKFRFADKPVGELIKDKNTDIVQYLLAKNGLFIMVNLPGFAVLKKTDIIYKYFNNDLMNLNEKVVVKFPKMPLKVIQTVINIFNKYTHEVYCLLYYDKIDYKFILYFPEQQCGAASISYDRSKDEYHNKPSKYLKCMDFHSHPFSNNSVGHHVNHSSTDVHDSLENFCISCVIDPKDGIGTSVFKFEAPVPVLNTLVPVPENEILDPYSKAQIILDYDPKRIVVKSSSLSKYDILRELNDWKFSDELDSQEL